MCVEICTGARNRNKVSPYEDLVSERVEVRPNRFLRVLHWTPKESVPNGNCVVSEDQRSTESRQRSSCFVVIFFVHGVGGCAELWHEQLKYFCRAGYEVVAPDLLGHGGSSSPRDNAQYEFSELHQDVLCIFDRYARKRNILVGHSYGSSFCSLVSAQRTRLVSKVVLIAGGGPIPLRPESCHFFCLPVPVIALFKPLLLCSFERSAFYDRSKIKASSKKLKAFSAPLFVLKAVLAGQNWMEGDVSFHNSLMVPVLLIYGAQDKFVSLDEEKSMLEAVYASTLEVIPEAGHMVMMECPEQVNWFIHNFLQRDQTTCSTTILSPSREVSHGSIHVRYPGSRSTRSQSLAVTSGESHLPGFFRSVSRLPRNSLDLPLRPKSYSLPGSSTQLAFEEESKAKVKLKAQWHKDSSQSALNTNDSEVQSIGNEGFQSDADLAGQHLDDCHKKHSDELEQKLAEHCVALASVVDSQPVVTHL